MGFRQRQKRFKSRAEFRQLDPTEPTGDRSCRRLQNNAQLPMQVLLEARNMDVKPEDFRRERVLARKFLRTFDTPLPG